MSSPVPPSDLAARESYIDWDELAGLDKIVTLYQVGANTVIVETCEGREVRITARFERRSAVSTGGTKLLIWAQSPAYARCVADDLVGCLEAAIVAVDRMHVY